MNWCISIGVPDEVFKYKDASIDMLTPSQSIWDEYHNRITTVKHRIELESLTKISVHSVPYSPGTKACNFDNIKIEII